MISIRARAALLLAAGLGFGATSSSIAADEGVEPEAPAAVRVLRTGGLRVETAALLWSGQQGGPVAVAARAIAIPGKNPAAPDKVKVAVVVEAAGGALAQAAESEDLASLPVDVAIYALDARGALAASVLETIEIPAPAETLRGKGLRFVGGFSLRPGTYNLRILAGHSGSRTFGLRTLPLNVPAAAEVPPLPETPPSGDGWLTVASLDARALGLPTGLEIDPAEREKMLPTSDVAPVAGVEKEEADAPGHWRRSEAAALRAAYARALSRLGAGNDAEAAATAAIAAITAVADFEVPLLSGPNAATREELTGLEGTVLRTLERKNPESLVPLMALYRNLHRVYQDRNLRQPAMHAVILVGSLAELYVRAVPTPEARRLAAGFLVSLTPNLDRKGLSSLVEAELKRALEIDPDLPQALLGQAQVDERHGHYAEALAGLARLEAQGPYDPEVAVRAAINTTRLGRIKRARELFLRIIAPLSERAGESPRSDAKDWPLALAAQELARLEIAAKNPPAAKRALDLGLARFPDDEKLLLLSAALADLPGAPAAEGAAAKERLAQSRPPAGSQASPRRRYGELPVERIEALWLSLLSASNRQLPALAAALGPSGRPAKAKGAP